MSIRLKIPRMDEDGKPVNQAEYDEYMKRMKEINGEGEDPYEIQRDL